MKAGKGKSGRPTGTHSRLLNAETIERICESIRIGMNFKTASANAGVGESTFHLWMKKARETGRRPYQDLLEAITRAEQEAKLYYIDKIHQIATGGQEVSKISTKYDANGVILWTVETVEKTLPSLKASIWFLERRFPKEFAPGQLMDISRNGNPFNVSLLGGILLGSGQNGPVQPGDEDLISKAK